jgi:surface glycoprotein (TIGR04207 family)/PGF-CTERM protein
MTGNTNKGRAVFLAVLMVVSVFGGTVAFSGSVAADETYAGGAVHYNNSSTPNATIEVPFEGGIDSASITPANITVLDDGDNVSTTVVNYTASQQQHTNGDGQVNLNTTDVFASNDLEVELSSEIATNDGEKDVAFAATAIDYETGLTGNDEFTEFQGTTIAFYNASDVSGFEIEDDDEDDFDYFQSFGSGDGSEVFYLDTGDRELGDYNLNNQNQNLTIRDLGLSVDVDELNVTTEDDIEGDVTSRSSDRNIEVELVDDGGDGDAVDTIETTTSGQGEYSFTFSTASRDGETFAVEVLDTASGVEVASSTITVSEADDDDANFVTNTVTEERGDIAEMTVETEGTDFATISVGNSDQGVRANATVEDEDGDGQVTVYLNTWELENANGEPFAVDSDSDDSVTDQRVDEDVDDLLDAGEYDLEVVAGEEQYGADADGVATLVMNERSTDNVRLWTGSKSEISPSDLEDVNEALEEGEITQSSEVAVGDFAVHQIEASGFEGILDARENEDVTQAFNDTIRNGPLNLTIEESDPGANQDADELKLDYSSDGNVSVIADGPNDTYFVIVDTDSVNFDGGGALPDDDDTALETNVTVLQDDNPDGLDFTPDEEFDDDENSETLVEFNANEPDVNIDSPFNVSQAEGQTVSGNTNIAPGSELQLRVRSQSGVSPSFLKTADPVVQSDGTYSATFDFSEQNVGDDYDIEVNAQIFDDGPEEESGTVVEAVATDTATPEPDTDTPEPDTDTPEPDTDTPEPDTDTPEPDTDTPTSTPTSTPGFGVVVALTALLAAALLAVRRE